MNVTAIIRQPRLNVAGLRLAMEDMWLDKAQATRFFLRRHWHDKEKYYHEEHRLVRAVDEGKVRTRMVGRRLKYNAWDCSTLCDVR